MDQRAVRLFRSADAHRDAGRWREAAQDYAAGLRHEGGAFPYWVQLGNTSKEAGDFPGAERAYDRAAEIAPEDVDLHMQRGHLASRRGDRDGMLRHWRHAATRNDGEGAWRLAAAELARAQSDWAAAAEAYRGYLAAHPGAGAVWIQLGHVHRSAGEAAPAETAYRTGMERGADRAEAQAGLDAVRAVIQTAAGHLSVAEQARTESGLTGAAKTHRTAAEHGGDRRDAQASVASLQPANRHLAAAELARTESDWTGAAEAYRAYLSVHPGDGAVWIQLGHALRSAGDAGAAARSYRTGMERGGSRDDAQGNLARMDMVAGHLAEAAAARTKSEWPAAVEAYKRYLAVHPGAASVWSELGNTHRSAGEVGPAEDAYRLCVELGGDRGDTLANLAWLRRMTGLPDDAAVLLREAYDTGCRRPEVVEALLGLTADPELLETLAGVLGDGVAPLDLVAPGSSPLSFARLMLHAAGRPWETAA